MALRYVDGEVLRRLTTRPRATSEIAAELRRPQSVVLASLNRIRSEQDVLEMEAIIDETGVVRLWHLKRDVKKDVRSLLISIRLLRKARHK